MNEPLDDQVSEPKLEEFDDLDENKDTFLGCIPTFSMDLGSKSLIPDASQLSVVRCTLTQPKNVDDWCNHAIFHLHKSIIRVVKSLWIVIATLMQFR